MPGPAVEYEIIFTCSCSYISMFPYTGSSVQKNYFLKIKKEYSRIISKIIAFVSPFLLLSCCLNSSNKHWWDLNKLQRSNFRTSKPPPEIKVTWIVGHSVHIYNSFADHHTASPNIRKIDFTIFFLSTCLQTTWTPHFDALGNFPLKIT